MYKDRIFIALAITFLSCAYALNAQQCISVIYACKRSVPFAAQLEKDKARNPHAAHLIDQMYQYAEQVDAYVISFRLEQCGQLSFFEMIPDGNNGISTRQYETGEFSYALITKDDRCYKNMAGSELVMSRSRNQVQYCISDRLVDFKWEVQSESKTLLGYPCYKAVGDYQGKPITAWFTPLLPVSNGPLEYGGLPGLILELHIWDNPSVFTAVEVQITPSGAQSAPKAYTPPCNSNTPRTLSEMWAEDERVRSRNRQQSGSSRN